MTADEIKSKLENEFNLHNIMIIDYDESTKELYLWIEINISEEFDNYYNSYFISGLLDYTDFDINYLYSTNFEGYPIFTPEITIKKGIFKFNESYIPKNNSDKDLLTNLSLFFETILQKWGVGF